MNKFPKFEEIEFQELEDWFANSYGVGFKDVEYNGYKISKSGSSYKSNSGKTHDWDIVYRIIMPSGKERLIEKASVNKLNRRNDGERNWGLPE